MQSSSTIARCCGGPVKFLFALCTVIAILMIMVEAYPLAGAFFATGFVALISCRLVAGRICPTPPHEDPSRRR